MADETVDHLIAVLFLVRQDYKGRHDGIASLIHWTSSSDPLGGSIFLQLVYDFKLLWDFTIVTDSAISHDCPDITLVRESSNEVFLFDVAIPGESRIAAQKGVKKLTKYVDHKIKVTKLWKARRFL